MDKINVTPKMIFDFFTGSGKITVDTDTVNKLMIKTIENLFARGNSVEDLTDGTKISDAVMNEYYISIPVNFSRDYFAHYVKTVRNSTTGRKRRKTK
jgi:hypothetical protein